jgi:hypothetical protein
MSEGVLLDLLDGTKLLQVCGLETPSTTARAEFFKPRVAALDALFRAYPNQTLPHRLALLANAGTATVPRFIMLVHFFNSVSDVEDPGMYASLLPAVPDLEGSKGASEGTRAVEQSSIVWLIADETEPVSPSVPTAWDAIPSEGVNEGSPVTPQARKVNNRADPGSNL